LHSILKTIILCLFLILFLPSLTSGKEASNITYDKKKVRDRYVDLVYINLNSPKIKVTPALTAGFSDAKKKYPLQSFTKFVEYYKPTAAINGTYFDTHTHKPVGTIVIERELVNNGSTGIAVCIDKDNQVTFHHLSGKLGSNIDWSPFESVICSGPSLITEGEVELNPRGEGFKDPAVYNSNRRSAIGLTPYNKLLFVTVKSKVTLKKLSFIMKDLGCIYAVNLDGGTSSALYYRGTHITKTSRKMSNVILVYEDRNKIKVKGFK